ncbi:MAG: hypothetical protein WD397_13310 [Wenzhouxiangellaceae bacterium]
MPGPVEVIRWCNRGTNGLRNRQQLPWSLNASLLAPSNAGLTSTRHAAWFANGRVDDDGASLQIGMFDDTRGSTWSVPLPAALHR